MNCKLKKSTLGLFLNNVRMNISKRRKQKKEEWISKDLNSKVPKLDKKSIYVPIRKELPF